MPVTSGAKHGSLRGLPRNQGTVLAAFALLLLAGCAGIPGGLDSVSGFVPERYLGRWYEIARLDHRFERGLVNVTAEYQKRADGDITVTNRGFDPHEDRWREAKGLAKFVGEPDRGRLKVSFFGPFYGGYTIVALDEQYRWAMVVGPTTDYLWILSRTPQLGKRTLETLVAKAKAAGFATDQLIYVDQSPRTPTEKK